MKAITLLVSVLVCVSFAHANFVAYVDLASRASPPDTNHPNVVYFARSGGGSGTINGVTITRVLKDFDTGSNTSVTMAVTGTDAFLDESFGVTNYAAGTDAATEFGTIVDNNGYIRHDTQTANSKIDCVLTGLNPAKIYTVVLTGARGNASYTTRIARTAISDVDSFTNASSAGTTFSGPSDPTDEFNTGDNTTASTGYVARFTNVRPGADGDMTITAGVGGGAANTGRQWYMNQLKLIEVPEPTAVLLLALGLPLVARRARR